MKNIILELSEESIGSERIRPIPEMDCDAIKWCFAVVFRFSQDKLVVEAPLFSFMGNFYRAVSVALRDRAIVTINDEYGSFRIDVAVEAERILLSDAFGGGSAEFNLGDLIEEIRVAYEGAVMLWEKYIPELRSSEAYFKVVREVCESETHLLNSMVK